MDFYLSWNNNEDIIVLPVRPSTYEMNLANLNQTVNITEFGEFNLIGKNALVTTSISSFFPAHQYNFITPGTFRPPFEYIALINKWKESRRPIRLIITETPINYAMAIESFTYGEDDGTGDVFFTLSLKEYRFINADVGQVITTTRGNLIQTALTKRETKPIVTDNLFEVGTSAGTVSKAMTGTTKNTNTVIKQNDYVFKNSYIRDPVVGDEVFYVGNMAATIL